MADGSRTEPTRIIYHIAMERDWQQALCTGTYCVSTRGVNLDEAGFIHAAFEHQVASIGAARYADAAEPIAEPIVVLVIDTARLEARVIVENLEGGAEGFPHIYGPLPVSAVMEVRGAGVTKDGRFVVDRPPDVVPGG